MFAAVTDVCMQRVEIINLLTVHVQGVPKKGGLWVRCYLEA